MAELPEVETIKNDLLPYVVGQKISGVRLLSDLVVQPQLRDDFVRRTTGQRIVNLSRRGKYLLFELASGEFLVIHLRMTGSLWVKPVAAPPEKYVRAVIYLDNGVAVHLRDSRHMGKMWLVKDARSAVGKLGPEPLEDGFTPEVLFQRLTRHVSPIKALLLDQTVIAGVGNMYADEALFRAKIHPWRLGSSLSQEEVDRLHEAILEVLKAGIRNKGASVESYFRPDGGVGTAHQQFQVAHRLGGDLCPVCGTPIERTVVRNRGTYFCPRCQPGHSSPTSEQAVIVPEGDKHGHRR